LVIDDTILTDIYGGPVDVMSLNDKECWVSLMGKFLSKWSHWGKQVRSSSLIMESLTGGDHSSIDFTCYKKNGKPSVTKEEAKTKIMHVLNSKFVCTAGVDND